MFGSPSMGDLVIATGDSSPDNEVFRESGNLGDQWNQGFVDFAGAQNMKVSTFCVFSSTAPKAHVSYYHHLVSVIRRKLFQISSPLKLLYQLEPNLV